MGDGWFSKIILFCSREKKKREMLRKNRSEMPKEDQVASPQQVNSDPGEKKNFGG